MSRESEVTASVHTDASAAPRRSSRSPFRQVVSALLRDRLALIGLVTVAVFVLAAALAPITAPQNPYDLSQLDILDSRLPPGSRSVAGLVYLIGTDGQGRDLLSAILYGLRTSILVGFSSAAAALVLGALIGLVSAYAGGRVDSFLMRIVDIQLSFPAILIALIFLAILGQGIDKIIFALIVTQWAYYARTIRGSALVERKRAYVDAARSMALPDRAILFRHILPNCLPPLIVVATMRVAYAIMLEATLSFLGIGLPVTEPSLGLLISNGFEYLLSGDYWISLFPGLALLLLIVAINLIGDALRDILNPRRES
ncbi:ABC transporter permease [Bradyrhizobium sp. CCGUVB1N3]|uniref:ABC transporter permease n=1 Tax=Bradyrhizobium sp. CCGUVB1N3 TaxID=2949629 RepID=UPI0020B351AD|nr:ABC transporter permease [Bradyrhizobium sp. CCGUVB1N3]MCP3469005.1 ABC transporter permease [Bradyrhizobium sp. CCGUVB1N3]